MDKKMFVIKVKNQYFVKYKNVDVGGGVQKSQDVWSIRQRYAMRWQECNEMRRLACEYEASIIALKPKVLGNIPKVCPDCHGSGYLVVSGGRGSTTPITCTTCNGKD